MLSSLRDDLLRRYNCLFAFVEHFFLRIPVAAPVRICISICAFHLRRLFEHLLALSMLSNTKLKRAIRLRSMFGGAVDERSIRADHSGARAKSRAGWARAVAVPISSSSAGSSDVVAEPALTRLQALDLLRKHFGAREGASSEDIRIAFATIDSVDCGGRATLGEMREALATLPREADDIAEDAEDRALLVELHSEQANLLELKARRAKAEESLAELAAEDVRMGI